MSAFSIRGFNLASWLLLALLLGVRPAVAGPGNESLSGISGGESSPSNREWLRNAETLCSDTRRPPAERVPGCRQVIQYSASSANWLVLADALRLAGDYDGALEAVSHAKPDPSGVLEKAEIYVVQGKYDLPIADVDHVVAPYPDDYGALNYRCWIRAIAGKDLDVALAICNQALALAPHDPAILDSVGLVGLKRGDLKSAIASYSEVLRVHPNAVLSRYVRGVAECESGDAEDGATDVREAEKRSPYIAGVAGQYGVREPACAK